MHNCRVPEERVLRILLDMSASPPRWVVSPSRAASLAVSLMLGPVACARISSDHGGTAVTTARDDPPDVPAVWPEKVYYRSLCSCSERSPQKAPVPLGRIQTRPSAISTWEKTAVAGYLLIMSWPDSPASGASPAM